MVLVVRKTGHKRNADAMPSWSRWIEPSWAVLSVIVFVIVQTPDHSRGKYISFVFCIRPKNVMAHLVINGVNPLPFRVIFSALFPVLRVNQIDLTVFVCFAGGFPPVDILIPLYLWVL